MIDEQQVSIRDNSVRDIKLIKYLFISLLKYKQSCKCIDQLL